MFTRFSTVAGERGAADDEGQGAPGEQVVDRIFKIE